MARAGKRTYTRDANGRFASTGASGARSRPAPRKAVTRGTNRLTRDNAGRIAGIGRDGATARGGRLRTAAGNLRATQTARLSGAPRAVVSRSSKARGRAAAGSPAIRPTASRTPATSRLRPGELMNANARPVNTMARFRKGENPYSMFVGGRNAAKNIEAAEAWAAKRGIRSERYQERRRLGKGAGVAIARARQSDKTMLLNTANDYWNYPRTEQIKMRRSGWHSSSSPAAVLYHEQGHLKDKRLIFRWQEAVNSSTSKSGRTKRYQSFVTAADPTLPKTARRRRGKEIETLARRVSRYATTNPSEFIAETYAGLKTGRRYDREVMSAYREAKGLSPRPAARRRSRLPKPKP